MKLPQIIAHMIFDNNRGAFYFQDVACYGNPIQGPWVEKFKNGKIRKYEYREMPVSGYSSVAKTITRNNKQISQELISQMSKTVDKVIKDAKITFP